MTETDPVESAGVGVTVNVQPGAELSTGGDDAIKLEEDDTTVNNNGLIESDDEAIVGGDFLTVNNGAGGQIISGDHGIVAEDDAAITNAGTITSGGDGLKSEDDLTLINTGTILAGDEGIQAENGNGDGADDVMITNSGTINAVDKAITNDRDDDVPGSVMGEDMTVINSGTIISQTNEAIEGGDGTTVINQAGGVIEAFDDAIQVGNGALIENAGRIENTQTLADVDPLSPGVEAQDAIDIDSGTITNFASGEIISTTNAAIDFDPGTAGSVINNAGLIRGTIAVNTDSGDTQAQTIFNAGELTGTSGTALVLGDGNDALTMMVGGTISGDSDFGVGMDSLTFEATFFDGSDGDIFAGAVFDGGDGIDTVTFAGALASQLTALSFDGTVLTVAFDGLAGDSTLFLTSWERFVFSDATLTYQDVVSTIAAVPLPAGVILLGSALGVLGAGAGRRRRRS